jgi:UDP-glucose 4-epimerase
MARVLVTGGAGAIGREVVALLLRSRNEVCLLDLRASQVEERTGLTRMGGDICAPRIVSKALEGADVVVHLVAVSRVADGEENPARCIRTNIVGTSELLRAAAQLADPPLVVFGSSREVYGQPAALPAAEDSPTLPINIYGWSKLAGEGLVSRYAKDSGAPALVLRFSNVYGTIHDHLDRIVPSFILCALRGREMKLRGPSRLLDLIYVHDAARAVILAVHKARSLPGADVLRFNVASGKGTTVAELADTICDRTQTNPNRRIFTAEVFDDQAFVGDPNSASKLLGFECKTSLETGLVATICAFRDATEKRLL